MTPELIRQLVIGAGCLLVGYVLGRWHADREHTGRARNSRDTVGAVLFVVIVGAFLVTFVQGQQQTACYRDYFTQVSESLKERSEATGAQNRELANFAAALASPGPVDDEGAAGSLRDASRRLEAARADAPIPQPPDCS